VSGRSQNNITEARRVFKDASQRKGLDWAEAVWERWILFEYQFGTLEEVAKTLSVVKEFKKIEDARRKKAWEAHAQAQAAAYVANGPAAPSTATAVVATVPSMDVDAKSQGVEERPLKRKRSVEEAPELSPTPKKAKHRESAVPAPVVPPVQSAGKSLSIEWLRGQKLILFSVTNAEPEAEKPALKR
jgi:hypothetical protein